MRADIRIAIIRRATSCIAKPQQGLGGNICDSSSPAGMRNGKRAARCHENHRNAIGEAQQNRSAGLCANDAIGSPMGSRSGSREVIPHLEHETAVHLIGNDKPIMAACGNIQRPHERHTIFADRCGVISNVVAQIERIIRSDTHPTAASGEGDNGPHLLAQRLINERAQRPMPAIKLNGFKLRKW